MILDPCSVWLLKSASIPSVTEMKEEARDILPTHLAVFQTEIRHTSHWRCFSACEILVDSVNPLRDMVVSLHEEFISICGRDTIHIRFRLIRRVDMLDVSPSLFHIVKLITSVLGILSSLLGFLLGLYESGFNIVQPLNGLEVRGHPFDLCGDLSQLFVKACC